MSSAQAIIDAAQSRIESAFTDAEEQLDGAVDGITGSLPIAVGLEDADIIATTTIDSSMEQGALGSIPTAPVFTPTTKIDLSHTADTFDPKNVFKSYADGRLSDLWGFVGSDLTDFAASFDPSYADALTAVEDAIAAGLDQLNDTPTGTAGLTANMAARIAATKNAGYGQAVTAMTKRGFPLPDSVASAIDARLTREAAGRQGQANASSLTARRQQDIKHLQATIKESLELQNNLQASIAHYADTYLTALKQSVDWGGVAMDAAIADIDMRLAAIEAEIAEFGGNALAWNTGLSLYLDPQLAMIEGNLAAREAEYGMQVQARELVLQRGVEQRELYNQANFATARQWNRWSQDVANTASDAAKVWGQMATSVIGAMNSLMTVEGSA